MFKDLRPNTPFYILTRGENPTLEIGSVVSVSQPMAKPVTQFNAMFPPPPEMVVDLKIKIGQNNFDFQKLPATAAIADFAPNGMQNATQNIVVSSNRDLIKAEIETMLAQSKGIVESVGHHEKVMKSCSEMLLSLNPALAKEMEQADEIQKLKQQIADMQKAQTESQQAQMTSFNELKQLLLDKGGSTEKEKENKSTNPKNKV